MIGYLVWSDTEKESDGVKVMESAAQFAAERWVEGRIAGRDHCDHPARFKVFVKSPWGTTTSWMVEIEFVAKCCARKLVS